MTMSSAIAPPVLADMGLERGRAASSSPLSSPENKVRKPREPRRPLLSPTRAISPNTTHSPHPLSQPPITATATTSRSSSALPEAPEPAPSPSPAIPVHLRQSLRRRRSSFPPAAGSSVSTQSWGPGTPRSSEAVAMGREPSSGFSFEGGWPLANGSTPMGGNWESLLQFGSDNGKSPTSVIAAAESPTHAQSAVKSEAAEKSTPLRRSSSKNGQVQQGGDRGDHAWRAILNQTLEVEGVGSVAVARILTEVWKRGGPSAVTAFSLWSSILVSLSLSPDHGMSARAGTPSAQAALSLQALYNVAIRPHEATIFAGFLLSYHASTAPAAANAFQETQVYGPWTPTKGLEDQDLAEWTTFTPGAEWPSLSTTLPSGSGLTPRREFSPALGLPPIDISVVNEDSVEERPVSQGPTEEGINGIDEILAEMEETTTDLHETTATEGLSNTSELLNHSPVVANGAHPPLIDNSNDGDVFQSRAERQHSASDAEPHVLAASPFMSGGSIMSATSASTNIPTVGQVPAPPKQDVMRTQPQPAPGGRVRPSPQLQLALPDAPFIPPPPMCMFFSPSFRDLQQGKVAVWKGDLVIRGRGGGSFNVLIIGEQGSDHLWQSHTWHSTLTYPPAPVVTETCTATMIPVSTLAREGLLPVTMGMVLCNDDKMDAFVHMVQGLHAEGVAFHLPMPGSGLPIVFLPAKFDSVDPLQRLGIAFMTKGGVPPTFSAPPTRRPSETENEVGSGQGEPKRRRKSSVSKEPSDIAPRPASRRKKTLVRPKTG